MGLYLYICILSEKQSEVPPSIFLSPFSWSCLSISPSLTNEWEKSVCRYQLPHILGLVCGVMSVVVILWTDVQDGKWVPLHSPLHSWQFIINFVFIYQRRGDSWGRGQDDRGLHRPPLSRPLRRDAGGECVQGAGMALSQRSCTEQSG